MVGTTTRRSLHHFYRRDPDRVGERDPCKAVAVRCGAVPIAQSRTAVPAFRTTTEADTCAPTDERGACSRGSRTRGHETTARRRWKQHVGLIGSGAAESAAGLQCGSQERAISRHRACAMERSRASRRSVTTPGRRGRSHSNPRARPGFGRASASIRPTFAGSSRMCKRHPGDRPSLSVWRSPGRALESPRELLILGNRCRSRGDAVRRGRAGHTVGVGSLRGPA